MNKTLVALMITAVLWAPLGAHPALAGETNRAGTEPLLLTLDYANAEVTDVIRALALQSRASVAMNPNVKGQVTVHLRGKTMDEAILIVSNLAGLGARKVNDTYVVAPRAEMRQTLERLGATRPIELAYLKPDAAIGLVQGAYPDLTARAQGKGLMLTGAPEDLEGAARLLEQSDRIAPEDEPVTLRVDMKYRPADKTGAVLAKLNPGMVAEPSGSSIVLSGTRQQVDTAVKALAALDVAGQPDVDVRVYNVKYASASQLTTVLERVVPEVQVVPGPESNAPDRPRFEPISGQFVGMDKLDKGSDSGRDSGAGPTPAGQGSTQGRPLSLLLKGAPDALEQAMRTLEMVDVAPRQIMVEAKVVETSPTNAEELGVKWDWTRFGAYESPAGTHVSADNGSIGKDFTDFFTRPLGFGAFSRVPWSFQAKLSAMISSQQATLLANPQIAVVDDQDASIFIGDTLRFQTLATSSATAGSQFTVVEVPVGIILLVHPRVNDDGNITMRVHPVVSTVTGIVDGLPQTSAREAETVVRVRDGDTLVIGGLIRDEDIKTMQKVPLLGDLPILGHLFRHTSKTHRRSEVMIVLTIKLMK